MMMTLFMRIMTPRANIMSRITQLTSPCQMCHSLEINIIKAMIQIRSRQIKDWGNLWIWEMLGLECSLNYKLLISKILFLRDSQISHRGCSCLRRVRVVQAEYSLVRERLQQRQRALEETARWSIKEALTSKFQSTVFLLTCSNSNKTYKCNKTKLLNWHTKATTKWKTPTSHKSTSNTEIK